MSGAPSHIQVSTHPHPDRSLQEAHNRRGSYLTFALISTSAFCSHCVRKHNIRNFLLEKVSCFLAEVKRPISCQRHEDHAVCLIRGQRQGIDRAIEDQKGARPSIFPHMFGRILQLILNADDRSQNTSPCENEGAEE